jgi:hypothetical protein
MTKSKINRLFEFGASGIAFKIGLKKQKSKPNFMDLMYSRFA